MGSADKWGSGTRWLDLLGEARLPFDVGSTADRGSWPPAPHGRDRCVLLVPGLLAPGATLNRMAAWLRTSGWRPVEPRVGLNVDCSQRLVEHLAGRLEAAGAGPEDRAIVIGHSRGGLLGRALAIQRPDLVRGAIGLAAPARDVLATSFGVRAQLRTLAALGSLGVPGLMSYECRGGGCCRAFRGAIAGSPPPGVRLFALYSKSDRVVDPRACHDPHAECRAVTASHLAMGHSMSVWSELANALAAMDEAL